MSGDVVPPGVLTDMPIVACGCPGVTKVTVVGVIPVGVIGRLPSTDTVEPATKPVPARVTL